MSAYWMAGLLMLARLHAQSVPQLADCSVNVYLLAGIPMPAGMSGSARRRTTQMFRDIGVNVRMRDGVPAHNSGDSCCPPIVVQFEDGIGYHGHEEAMAYANPYKGSGTCIHIFIDRVVRLNHEPGFANLLLAHVMAHEITHVLEGVRRHSDEGIMKAAWSERDYAQMKDHWLPFAAEDVALIREGLIKRSGEKARDVSPAFSPRLF